MRDVRSKKVGGPKLFGGLGMVGVFLADRRQTQPDAEMTGTLVNP